KAEALTAKLMASSTDSEAFHRTLKAADLALEEEETAFRRAAKAKAKADQANKNLEKTLKGETREEG
ncbi:MAG: hypothetical protein KJ658_01835, partial [Proteobacteria bacterium]|nr:hypothetical protein [Pseudomonadota bacterium]